MATTEQRTGFRLPWSSDARATVSAADEPTAPEAGAVAEPGWPTAEEEAARSALPPTPTPVDPPPAGRPNPLRAELARAMHAAAETARDQALERLAADATARVEAIRAASADEAGALKARADADVTAIRERTKAELARIREDAERRTAERRAALEREMAAHGTRLERRTERVRAAVAAFEVEMSAFFESLLAEEDPTRVALIAERLPEPPGLEFEAELDELDAFDELGGTATDGEPDRLTAEGAASAESEALVGAVEDGDVALPAGGGPARTEIAVVGLVSVASIAGFKREITRLPGVSGAGVTSGPDGAFVFGISHEPGLDLAAALGRLPGFETRLTGEHDGRLHLTAHDDTPERPAGV